MKNANYIKECWGVDYRSRLPNAWKRTEKDFYFIFRKDYSLLPS